MILAISVVILLAIIPGIFYPFVVLIQQIHTAFSVLGSYFLTYQTVAIMFAWIAIEMYIGISAMIKK